MIWPVIHSVWLQSLKVRIQSKKNNYLFLLDFFLGLSQTKHKKQKHESPSSFSSNYRLQQLQMVTLAGVRVKKKTKPKKKTGTTLSMVPPSASITVAVVPADREECCLFWMEDVSVAAAASAASHPKHTAQNLALSCESLNTKPVVIKKTQINTTYTSTIEKNIHQAIKKATLWWAIYNADLQ